MSSPDPVPVDSDRDGRYDLLRFAGAVTAPTAGDYLISAQLRSPTLLILSHHEHVATLPAGRSAYQIDFPGELVGANGSGRYRLEDVTITAVIDPANRDQIHPVETGELDAAQWIGGTANITTLVELWRAAQANGGIASFGLYASQANRLDRVERAVKGHQPKDAARELDTFIGDIRGAHRVETDWMSRIIGYAGALRATM